MKEKNGFCLHFYTFLVQKEDIERKKTERLKNNVIQYFIHIFNYCITSKKMETSNYCLCTALVYNIRSGNTLINHENIDRGVMIFLTQTSIL